MKTKQTSATGVIVILVGFTAPGIILEDAIKNEQLFAEAVREIATFFKLLKKAGINEAKKFYLNFANLKARAIELTATNNETHNHRASVIAEMLVTLTQDADNLNRLKERFERFKSQGDMKGWRNCVKYTLTQLDDIDAFDSLKPACIGDTELHQFFVTKRFDKFFAK